MGRLTALRSNSALRGFAVASLIMNIVIIVTGGLVRLTDSGLGCPTWPQCSPGSYTPHAALGVHGVIEFSNRMLTFMLMIIAALTFIVALLHRTDDRRYRRRVRWLTFGLGLGIPFQGVIGGITVRTHLNPYVVALHTLDSLVLVALSVWLIRITWSVPTRIVAGRTRALSVITFGLAWVVVCLGTVVTGSGPHAGDIHARRTGLNPADVVHVHSGAVYLLVAATIGCLILLRNRAAMFLLLLEVAQAIVGFVQYYSNLPIGLVSVHMLGAAATMALAANLLCSVRLSPPPGSANGSETGSQLRADSEPASDHPASAVLPRPSQPAPAGSRPTHRSGPATAAPPAPDRV